MPALQLGLLIHYGQLCALPGEVQQQLAADVGVGHLTAAEADGDLDPVVKLMPSRTLPGLSVSFSMPDASARVVESEVTSKLESMLARIGGIKSINSTSSNGSGYISLGFDKNTDMQQARFEASAIIRQAWSQLPDGVSYPSLSSARTIRQSARPILSYVINAPGAASDIMQYAEENIRPAIGVIRGVNRVALSGATPKDWQLTYNRWNSGREGSRESGGGGCFRL